MTVLERIDLWRTLSTPEEQAAAGVMATSIAVSEATLHTLMQSSLGIDGAVAEVAAKRLLARPFVQRTGSEYQMATVYAQPIAESFRESSPAKARQISRELLQRERAGDGDWFARARVAFYLASLDPHQSVKEFIGVFAEAENGNDQDLSVTLNRAWLSSLALRQSSLLSDYERELRFFAGFKAYVGHERSTARAYFDAVLEDASLKDRYRAIALHLRHTLRSSGEQDEGALRESVQLSQRLSMSVNEVMARNTLTYALLRREDPGAKAVATKNLERAEVLNDDYLISWCQVALAAVDWNLLRSRPRSEQLEQSPYIISKLRDAARLADRNGDANTRILAINQIAFINVNLGRPERALEEIEEVVAERDWWSGVEAFEKLNKTLWSIRSADLKLARRAERMIAATTWQ